MSNEREQSPPVDLVGMTPAGLDSLPLRIARRLFAADVIFTSGRLANLLPDTFQAKIRVWPTPFDALLDEMEELREAGKRIAVIATGDPLHFGVGATLRQRFSMEDMRVWPAPSAFSLAAARLGWPLEETVALSLHGRSPACIERYLCNNARLLVLTDATSLPQVCARLKRRGLDDTRITLLANLDGDEERVLSLSVQEAEQISEELRQMPHVLALECRLSEQAARAGRMPLPLAAGLPDDAFAHDGQITKAPMRAITVSALCPRPHAILWDIGAGCGSVAIEWLRLAGPAAHAVAVEQNESRARLIAQNADVLGTPRLRIVTGKAPEALRSLPAPNAVFIGGGLRNDDIFKAAWEALKPGGVLVANAVSLAGEAALLARHAEMGGELMRFSTSMAAPLVSPQSAAQTPPEDEEEQTQELAGVAEAPAGLSGAPQAFRPAFSVTQWRIRKPW